MGTLIYGPKVHFEVDDQSLFHLDVLMSRLRGAPFQLHVMLAGAQDGTLASLAMGPGVAITLQYFNGPELDLDYEVIDHAVHVITDTGFVSVPFDFSHGQDATP
jgi:hypothetical protein